MALETIYFYDRRRAFYNLKKKRGIGYRNDGDNHGNSLLARVRVLDSEYIIRVDNKRFSSTGTISIEESTTIFVALPTSIKINKSSLKLISPRKEA